MYLSRRMPSGGFAVYRQGLAEVLQIYNKVERKTSLNPCPAIIRFGRDYHNQICPQGLKLSNPPNAGRYFSDVSDDSKMQPSPPNQWFSFPSWYSSLSLNLLNYTSIKPICTHLFALDRIKIRSFNLYIRVELLLRLIWRVTGRGRWVIGSAISLVLSFWNNERIQKLKRIEGNKILTSSICIG